MNNFGPFALWQFTDGIPNKLQGSRRILATAVSNNPRGVVEAIQRSDFIFEIF